MLDPSSSIGLMGPPDPLGPAGRQSQLPVVRRKPGDMTVSGWPRAAVVFLGLAGLGSGAAAVFITHLEAGPVGLLAVGLVLLLVGTSGRLPNRLKVGDNEAGWDLDAAASKLEDLAEATPSAEQPRLIDALEELAKVAPRVAAPALSAMAYEAMVARMLADVIDDLPGTVLESAPDMVTTSVVRESPALLRADAVIWAGQGRRIAVEITASAKRVGSAVRLAGQLLYPSVDSSDAPASPASGFLLITRTSVKLEELERILHDLPRSARARLVCVTVRGPEDRHALLEGVQDVLGRIGNAEA